MKKLIVIISLVLFVPIFAGLYGYSEMDNYDPVTGFYYKGIKIKLESKGFMSKGPRSQVSNINIYNPASDKSTLVFKDKLKRHINVFIYETGFHEGVVSFNEIRTSLIKNNRTIVERKPRNKLLVGVRDNKKKITTLWVFHKDGSNGAILATVPFSSDWHIDVGNSKLRVVSARNETFRMSSYDW